MAYLGSTPTTQSFIAGTDTFSGTGSQTAFTLTRSVSSVNDILVVVNNVDQQPSAYTVSGSTLTMSAAPSSGTNNVYVRYMSTTLQTFAPSDLTVSSAKIQTNAVTTDKIADANITAAKLNGAQSGSAPIYAARAWVNFNGTGTVAIRASGNVSSITDSGVGLYTVNFTTAMPDANYAVAVAGGSISNQPAYGTWDTPTTTSVRVGNGGVINAYAGVDGLYYGVAIFR